MLYVDGELPGEQIQERMRELCPASACFELIDLDSQGAAGIPYLHTLEGQAWLEPELDGVEVLFLDNMAALAPFSVKDLDAQSRWNAFQMRLRARGLMVVTVHQAGKLGNQRLTSANDDPLDVQIKLTADDEERDPTRSRRRPVAVHVAKPQEKTGRMAK